MACVSIGLGRTENLPRLHCSSIYSCAVDIHILYLVVSNHVVSTVLLCDKLGEQKPGICPYVYVSKSMVNAETWYLPLENLILALMVAARKLMHYFQVYTINVLTEHPLGLVLR